MKQNIYKQIKSHLLVVDYPPLKPGILANSEQEQLTYLQRAADRVMLRKARAAVLLRFRGERLPTLTELRQLTMTGHGFIYQLDDATE